MRSLPCLLLLLACGTVRAADWPQFMANAAHIGDAADEKLQLPLGLVAQVKLEDAIMTAPAIVDGRAYVVDQMGTAYCIDPTGGGRVVWRAAPDGAGAMGFNTSSPCVTGGRVYYGTTAGRLHILDAATGKTLRTLAAGAPILSAPTAANNSIYFQALDAVLRCINPDGGERWRWDHYARYKEPPAVTKAQELARGHPGSYDRPHYGGGDVAVSGKRIVTSFGWDIVCLRDDGDGGPNLLWCTRAPTGRDGSSPMSSSIAGEWAYNAGMGADGELRLTRLSMADGTVAKDPGVGRRVAYPWVTPAVRGAAATAGNGNGRNGVELFDLDARKPLASWHDDKDSTPLASSQVLTQNHLIATTLRGEVIVTELNGKAGGGDKPKAFRFRTPNGKGIGSTPAVVDGRVYFGCDDGYFYVLGPEGKQVPAREANPSLHKPRTAAANGAAWPSTYGNPGNTSFVDDAAIKPPLRVRWATRGFGHQLSPCITADGDVLTVTLLGLVTCQEQATGRLRWRTQMPGPQWPTSSGMLAADGRVFVPRPTYGSMAGVFYCLDQRDGRLIWSADIGGRYIWERAAPVMAGGVVAFGSGARGESGATVIQAWNPQDGKPSWQVELNVSGKRAGSVGGCTDGKTMYFTAGAEAWQWKPEGDRQRGECVAIDAATGNVRWRNHDVFGETYPVLSGDRLFLNTGGLNCVNPSDGKLIWARKAPGQTRFSIGEDFLVMRGYGGHGEKVRLADGKDYPGCKELGGPTHACGSVALTARYAIAITVGGLNVRDVRNGELLWQSPGFAPRACVNPTVTGGRIFWPSAASGVVYCWEPFGEQKP